MNYIAPVKTLSGRGKGGGSGEVRTPIEQSNTLRSRSTVTLIDMLGEGPMHGFCTEEGYDITDAVLVSKPVIVDGGLTFPSGFSFSSFGAGYPYNLDYPIYAYVDGDGEGASIRVDIWPKDQSQVAAFLARFPELTSTVQVRPEGAVARCVLVSPGSDYTSATVLLPPATWQSIFFDELPLANPVDLSLNFRDVRVSYRMGYSDQSVMPGFDSVAEVLDVPSHAEVSRKNDANGYSFVLNGDYDRLVVNLTLPAGFYRRNTVNGDILQLTGSNSVRLQIFQEYTNSSMSSYSQPQPFGQELYTISGKTMSPVQRSYEGKLFKLPGTTGHAWRITIKRITLDDEEINDSQTEYDQVSRFGFENATAYTDLRLNYPNTALVGLELNADQFDRIPVRSYRLKMLKVLVPSNYFPPFSRRSDGTYRKFAEYNRSAANGSVVEVIDSVGNRVDQLWDGTFYLSWTNNPAWIVYAICTQDRIGLGDYLPGVKDKWGLYQIGRDCDRTVKNGYSNGAYTTEESLYTLTAYIQSPQHAFSFLGDCCSVFRGFAYWRAGSVAVVQDRRKTTRMSFNKTEVKDGLFDYSSTARKARHTVAIVQFNDPERGYKLSPVVFEDPEGILAYGYRPLKITRFGCTSKGEARRAAKGMVLDEMANGGMLNFVTGVKGSVLRPFDIIDVYDPDRSGVPFSGRILGLTLNDAGNSVLTTDRPVAPELLTADSISNYRLVCSRVLGELLPEDVESEAQILELAKRQQTELLAVKGFGEDSKGRLTITLFDALPADVVVGGVWGLRSSLVVPQTFKVLIVEETGKHEFAVSCVKWSQQLFDSIENDDPFFEAPINPNLNVWRTANPPTDLVLHVNSKYEQEVLVHDLEVSWTKPRIGFARSYEVHLAKGQANHQFVTSTTATNVRIRLTEADSYSVRVYTRGFNNVLSSPLTGTKVVGTISGDNVELISGLELLGQANGTEFAGNSATFVWRVNWSQASSEFQQGPTPTLPPLVSSYLVKLTNPVTGMELFRTEVRQASFQLDLETNKNLPGGPFRDIIFTAQVRTVDGAISAPTSLRVHNSAPTAPTFTVSDDQNSNAVITVTSVRQADFKAYAVWADSSPGFTPLPANLRYLGDSSLITLPLVPGTVYYVRVAELDQLSTSPELANYSTAQTITTSKAVRLSAFDFRNPIL